MGLLKQKMPVFFISHGAPDTLLKNPEVANSWQQQINDLPRPDAIVMISAHWETPEFYIGGNREGTTIYDFGGFDKALYEYEYPSPAAIVLAEELSGLLNLKLDHERGLDHGAWVPLVAMYPDHDIPIAQISVAPMQDIEDHFKLGQRLASLREKNILIIGSGAIIHNLGQLRWQQPDAQPDPWAVEYVEEMLMAVAEKDWVKLIQLETITNGRLAHPSLEHYLPLLIAAGAGESDQVSVFSDRWCYGNLAMHSLRFG